MPPGEAVAMSALLMSFHGWFNPHAFAIYSALLQGPAKPSELPPPDTFKTIEAAPAKFGFQDVRQFRDTLAKNLLLALAALEAFDAATSNRYIERDDPPPKLIIANNHFRA